MEWVNWFDRMAPKPLVKHARYLHSLDRAIWQPAPAQHGLKADLELVQADGVEHCINHGRVHCCSVRRPESPRPG